MSKFTFKDVREKMSKSIPVGIATWYKKDEAETPEFIGVYESVDLIPDRFNRMNVLNICTYKQIEKNNITVFKEFEFPGCGYLKNLLVFILELNYEEDRYIDDIKPTINEGMPIHITFTTFDDVEPPEDEFYRTISDVSDYCKSLKILNITPEIFTMTDIFYLKRGKNFDRKGLMIELLYEPLKDHKYKKSHNSILKF